LTAQSENPVLRFDVFLRGGLIIGAVAFLLAKQVHSYPLWFVTCSVLLFAIPIVLSGSYIGTVHQTHRLAFYAPGGWMHSLFSRRIMRVVGWVIWALMTSFLMLLQLNLFSTLEWVAFFLVVPVYWLVFSACHREFAKEVRKPFIARALAITWTGLLTPIIMVMIYAGLILAFGSTQGHLTLEATIAAKRLHLVAHAGSAIVEEALQVFTAVAGVKDFAHGKLDKLPWLVPWLLNAFGGLVIFYNACAMLACLAIPLTEYRRVFGPLSEEPSPPIVGNGRIATVSFFVTVLTLLVYVPLVTSAENSFRQSPEWAHSRERLEALIVTKVDEIDGVIYQQGTIEQIEAAKAKAFRSVSLAVDTLEKAMDEGFQKMEGNVDGYLDWHYSLPAEYGRIFRLLTGSFESYMEERLAEHLYKSDPLKNASKAIDDVVKANDAALSDYQAAVKKILGDRRLDVLDVPNLAVRKTSMRDVLTLPEHPEVIVLRGRLTSSAVAGFGGVVVGTMIGKKVAGKVASKGVMKIAAKAVAKALASKTTAMEGAAGGAVIGAAAGSVIPLVGTAAGAVIGAAVGGIATTVAVDKTLLILEEQLSRKKFKDEILGSIAEAKKEWKREYLGR
jgi:hypothetical protein